MAWADLMSAANAGALGALGEPVTLPWASSVQGIFEPQGGPQPAAWGADITRASRVSQEPGPVVTLASTVCSELERGDLLIIRGATYKVRRLTPDGSGWTRCELTLAERVGLHTLPSCAQQRELENGATFSPFGALRPLRVGAAAPPEIPDP
jgi:hypothetical protein